MPNLVIEVPERNEEGFAAMVCFFEMACGISGYMSGVNPFNQPGVEEGKNATYALFERKGYEAKKAELEAAPKKDAKYII